MKKALHNHNIKYLCFKFKVNIVTLNMQWSERVLNRVSPAMRITLCDFVENNFTLKMENTQQKSLLVWGVFIFKVLMFGES